MRMRQIDKKIQNDLNYIWLVRYIDNIYNLIPWPDPPFPFNYASLHDASLTTNSPTGLRVIKTHWEADFVPYSPAAKYVVVIRDPKLILRTLPSPIASLSHITIARRRPAHQRNHANCGGD